MDGFLGQKANTRNLLYDPIYHLQLFSKIMNGKKISNSKNLQQINSFPKTVKRGILVSAGVKIRHNNCKS